MLPNFAELPERLGAVLRRHRSRATLSLSAAAEALGVSPATLSRVESGKLLPSRGFLESITTLYKLENRERKDLRAERFMAAQANPGMRSTDDVIRRDKVGSRESLIFLCHSSGDKERVRNLYQRLSNDGIRCWFDEENLLPGQDWEY